MPWRGPQTAGEFPTLGYLVADWIESSCVIPDGERMGAPYLLTEEQARFLLWYYRLDVRGRWAYNGSQFRRPQKHGKDPLAAAICLAEGIGPAVFAGWDASGEPVGRPFPAALIQALAVSEGQTDNLFGPLYSMVVHGPLANYPGMDPGLTRVNLPGGGRIEPVTSNARSRLGRQIRFSVLDETHLWVLPGEHTLASAVRRNLAGMGGRWLEITNAWDPSERSVAQLTGEGGAKDVYIDDRPGNAVDLTDDVALLKEIIRVYGDSARANGGWVDEDRILTEIRRPSTTDADAERFFLNRIVAGAKTAIDAEAWDAAARTDEQLRPGDAIAIGFDGSRSRDATSLIASRLSDGRLFHLRTWFPEQYPDHKVPRDQVDKAITDIFEAYTVVKLYADPYRWQDYLDLWLGRYPKIVIEYPTNVEQRMDAAIELFLTAFRAGILLHDGSEILAQHAKNSALAKGRRKAPREDGERGLSEHYLRIVKKKEGLFIDSFIAAILSYAARGQAIEDGALHPEPEQPFFASWR